ncbi:hypothetical protein AAY473_007652, partial [Plecturocebus cupreus]
MRSHYIAQAGLKLLVLRNPPTSASPKFWDYRHEPQQSRPPPGYLPSPRNFRFSFQHSPAYLRDWGYRAPTDGGCHVVQAGLKLLNSINSSILASQRAEITHMSRSTWPTHFKHEGMETQKGLVWASKLWEDTAGVRKQLWVQRLKCSGIITAHCISASEAQAILPLQPPKWELHYVSQAGLELLGSSDPPTLASQNAGIT